MREPLLAVASRVRRGCPLLLLLLGFAATALGGPLAAWAVAVEEIPSPRPAGWAVDLTGKVPRQTLAQIDRLGDQVRAAQGIEMAVVVIPSTDGVASRQFATRLLNHWGIGERGKNNGVLLFVAVSDRKMELILGGGLAAPGMNAASAEILNGTMRPLLRQGDVGGAVLAGAHAIASRLLDVTPASAPGTTADPAPGSLAAEPAPQPISAPLPAPPAAAPASTGGGGAGTLLAFLGIAGLAGGAFRVFTRPPLCAQCKTRMIRLPDQVTESLTPTELLEERLGSIDYILYICPVCGRRDKRARRRLGSRYERCPICAATTVEVSQYTVRAATTEHEGLLRTDRSCKNCSHALSSTSTIPVLAAVVASSASDDDSSSSSFSSSDSSSSSSDSGFSGGSASGDSGASSDW